MNNSNNHAPYNSGRGFMPMTAQERQARRKEMQFGKGGLGLRYGEWMGLPNATGEVLRGASANYDWRMYTPKTVPLVPRLPQRPGKPGTQARGDQDQGRPDVPMANAPLVGPGTPGPMTPQAFAESNILPADADKGGMNEDAWAAESPIHAAGPKLLGARNDAFAESNILPAWAPKTGMREDTPSNILPASTPSWGSSRGNGSVTSSPQLSMFADNGPTDMYVAPTNMGRGSSNFPGTA